MNNFSDMKDHELLKIFSSNHLHESEINKVWRRRHNMNCPYMVDAQGNIINKIINAFVGRSECDQLILDQADKIKERRGIK